MIEMIKSFSKKINRLIDENSIVVVKEEPAIYFTNKISILDHFPEIQEQTIGLKHRTGVFLGEQSLEFEGM
ncbi:MAG: hypothetical protein ACQEWV_10110 [Bacillota bacterium]